ncbi:MAG TPA: hypothetical protein VEF90_04320 [Xanthobacteraceae bacterium]|nr:hypothetical protein [Xanthobacteraceae bacterium]
MPALLPVLVAGSYLVLAADQIPQLDTDASCHASAAAAIVVNRSEDVCKRDERDARAKLEQQWAQFTAAEKARCVELSRLGGFPSYVELLTCLEMAEATKKLPPADKLTGGVPK